MSDDNVVYDDDDNDIDADDVVVDYYDDDDDDDNHDDVKCLYLSAGLYSSRKKRIETEAKLKQVNFTTFIIIISITIIFNIINMSIILITVALLTRLS